MTIRRPIRVVFGKERFSEEHAWEDLLARWDTGLARRVVIDAARHGQLAEALHDRDADVVVPLWSPLPAATIRAGRFGLVQQFGAGVDNIDIAACTEAGVWVANLPGYNAPHVAEHAIALLLALVRRLPEASEGFLPNWWGAPCGGNLLGGTVCLVGLGAVGGAIAKRLRAFDVGLIGVRRDPAKGTPADMPDLEVWPTGHLAEAVARANAVIIAASHEPGRGPLVTRDVIAAIPAGSVVINVARGALLDEDAALEGLDTGRLGGLRLDVFSVEPYPTDGPLRRHPKVLATAHNAALTASYFQIAGSALAHALGRYLHGTPPQHLLNDVTTPRGRGPAVTAAAGVSSP